MTEGSLEKRMSAYVKENRCGAVNDTVTFWSNEGCVCHLSISWRLTPPTPPTSHTRTHTLGIWLSFSVFILKKTVAAIRRRIPGGESKFIFVTASPKRVNKRSGHTQCLHLPVMCKLQAFKQGAQKGVCLMWQFSIIDSNYRVLQG